MVYLAIYILPSFLAILYTVYSFYQYAGFFLLVVNVYLLYYAFLYLSLVLRQNRTIAKEIEYRDKFRATPDLYPSKINHVVVFPIYSESIGIVQQSLQILSEHEQALDYVIVLALEERDKLHHLYAKSMPMFIKNFSHRMGALECYDSPIFKKVLVTVHPSEAVKGKHTNLNYALPHVYGYFENRDKVLVTITDADAHIPSLYMQHISRKYSKESDYVMYAPSSIFAQNPSMVPNLVRVKDGCWALAHMSSYSNKEKVHPLSTYSISLNFIHELNYWDVSEYGIGEDSAMMFKAVTFAEKHKIDFYVQAVLIPVNYRNVNAGSYFATIKESYNQSLRHNLAYLMLEKSIITFMEFKTKRMLGLVFLYFEVVFITLVLGWIWMIAGICGYEWLTGMENINKSILGEQWSEVLIKFNCIAMLIILPLLASFYDLNHFLLGKYRLFGMAKYASHSMLAHFDIWFFPISCLGITMTSALHGAWIVFSQQIKKMCGGDYNFMVDGSKKQ